MRRLIHLILSPSCRLARLAVGEKRVACDPVIAEDARQKIAALPEVREAKVHIVWDPVWSPQMISPAGRKSLGLE